MDTQERYIEVGLDDIIEYMEEGVLVTGIIVNLEHSLDDLVRVFEWPAGVEVEDDNIEDRFSHVSLSDIVGVKVSASKHFSEVKVQ